MNPDKDLPTPLQSRLAAAATLRQTYEKAHTLALRSQSITRYEAALEAARIYTNTLDGIIAAHVKMLVTQ